jgi:hypothetical protein
MKMGFFDEYNQLIHQRMKASSSYDFERTFI